MKTRTTSPIGHHVQTGSPEAVVLPLIAQKWTTSVPVVATDRMLTGVTCSLLDLSNKNASPERVNFCRSRPC